MINNITLDKLNNVSCNTFITIIYNEEFITICNKFFTKTNSYYHIGLSIKEERHKKWIWKECHKWYMREAL